MGRGLSPLQKTVLRLALDNRVAEGDPAARAARRAARRGFTQTAAQLAESTHPVDVYRALADYYEWGHRAVWPWSERVVKTRKPGGWTFSRDSVGAAQYNAGQAAVSRALRRLEDRGLITVRVGVHARWTGANLTEAGVLAAEALSSSPGRCAPDVHQEGAADA